MDLWETVGGSVGALQLKLLKGWLDLHLLLAGSVLPHLKPDWGSGHFLVYPFLPFLSSSVRRQLDMVEILLTMPLTLITQWADTADAKLMIFFFFFLENRI